MIDEIHVSNLALIREATLAPCAGLTVLTGETGAGKTALLSALKLLIGERADAALVREGEEGAVAEGRFFEGPRDLTGFTVSRRVGADGRSRVRVDGSIASVRELTARMRPLIDLCGQHEHQRLLDAASHVEMVDAWGAVTIAPALAAYRNALEEARDAARELARVEEAARARGSMTRASPSIVSPRWIRSRGSTRPWKSPFLGPSMRRSLQAQPMKPRRPSRTRVGRSTP